MIETTNPRPSARYPTICPAIGRDPKASKAPAVFELRNASGLTNQERRHGRRCPRRLGHRIPTVSERPDLDVVGMLPTSRCGARALKAVKPAGRLNMVRTVILLTCPMTGQAVIQAIESTSAPSRLPSSWVGAEETRVMSWAGTGEGWNEAVRTARLWMLAPACSLDRAATIFVPDRLAPGREDRQNGPHPHEAWEHEDPMTPSERPNAT